MMAKTSEHYHVLKHFLGGKPSITVTTDETMHDMHELH